MYNTEIWVKKEYTKFGIPELVRIIYNPYGIPAKEIMKSWILLEFLHECRAINKLT